MNRCVGLTLSIIIAGLISANGIANAAVVTPGNLLVSDNGTNTVTEYTTAGTFVQSFSVAPQTFLGLRDVVVDDFGSIHLFNGTFSPVLSTIDPISGSQTDRAGDFSTSNTLGYGGIAATANRVFVNDSDTSGSPNNGLISWEIGGGFTPTRFATEFAANDLTVGQDGQLYALGSENSSTLLPARYVNVYNPQTLTRTEQIDLLGSNAPAGLRALTADNAGNLFGVAFDNQIVKLDRSGNVIDTLTVTSAQNVDLADIDISSTGVIAAASTNGEVFLTNTDFSIETMFNASTSGSTNYYVGFTSSVTAIPEPSTVMAMIVIVGVFAFRIRRKQRVKLCPALQKA